MRVLRARERANEFVENLLESELDRSRLAPVDRALCQELVCGVVRWQATLDWLIERKTEGRQQKGALQILLRLGLYQLFWLDRVPDHAAVHETVNLTKDFGYGSQAGFVNAVLRGYTREKHATRDALAELRANQPALGYSHPEWLVERWTKRWGQEQTRRLLEWNNMPPRTYARGNTLRGDLSKLIEMWRMENVEYDFKRWDWTGENLVFELKVHPSLARLPSFRQGWFYVQDPSTLLAVRELEPQAGDTVLDLCAAPGGKTTFMAALMEDKGRIVAEDISPDRLKLIQQNCTRLKITCIEPKASPAKTAVAKPEFDKALVDAPCSNTGVMRRRVELRWRIEPAEIDRLCGTQLELLQRAAARLKPGGTLVYSTCSLEPEENGAVVQRFLAEQPAFQLVRERELLPLVDGVDGAYVAKLKRT